MFDEELKCSIPCYKTGEGNGCKIIVGDNITWIPVSEKSCLNRIAKHYFVDLKELKRRTREIIGKQKCIPLVFHEDCTYIPYKARHPLFKDDGAYGHFRLEALDRIEEQNGKVMLVMDNGMRIKSLTSAKTLRENIVLAKMLRVALRYVN